MAEHVSVTFDTARFTQRLTRFLGLTTRDSERAAFETAAAVLGDVQDGWPVDSGASRAGWSGPHRVRSLEYTLRNPFLYAAIVEYGGYASPGAKTERFSGTRLAGGVTINPGVYPRQRPQAPLRRALAKNYGEMGIRIKASHQEHWGR